jgi:hypothetical protein
MLINLLLYVMAILRLWTAGVLVVTGRRNRLANLYWLAVSFVFIVLASTGSLLLGGLAASLWVFQICLILSMLVAIVFVTATFYRNRKSPAPWMWGIAVVLAAIALYGSALSASTAQQHPLVVSANVLMIVIFGWQGRAGYEAWQGVASEKTVEDWIKGRYQLVIWFSLVQIVSSLASVVRIVGGGGSTVSPLGNLMALVSLLANIAVTLLSWLAWAAPAGFYRWLNRHYKPAIAAVPEMSEEELMLSLMQSKS